MILLLKRSCVGIIVMLLCLPAVISAQTGERSVIPANIGSDDFDGSHLRMTPEVQTYTALCKSMYWHRMGKQTTDPVMRIRSYRNAMEYLKEAIRLDPDSSFLFTKLSEIAIDINPRDIGSAIPPIKKALELNPENADAHYWFGKIKFHSGDRKGAIQEFKRTAELEPEHIGTQNFLGSLFFEEEDYAGAAKAYSEVVRVMPYTYSPRLRYRLGYSYMKIGRTAEAIMDFNAAARLDSDYLAPHFHLAFLYAQQSRNKEAIKECLIVLKRSPDDELIALLLAELYVAMDEYDMAIPVLEKLLYRKNLEKQSIAEAHYRLAAAYKGKYEDRLADLHFRKSIEVYEQMLKDESENSSSHYYLAMVYDARGDIEKAEWHLREYIRMNPGEPNAYNYLGYMLVQNGEKLEEALDFIKKAVSEEPDNGAFRDSLGWAYFKMGNIDEAIVELERAAELIPDDSEVREHLGEVYLKKGGDYTRKALVQWEKALEIKPDEELKRRFEELSESLEWD